MISKYELKNLDDGALVMERDWCECCYDAPFDYLGYPPHDWDELQEYEQAVIDEMNKRGICTEPDFYERFFGLK